MTKQQIVRLSKTERIIISSKRKKAVEALFLNAEQYEKMKPQLDKPFRKSGIKYLSFADCEIAIDAETVVIIDDL